MLDISDLIAFVPTRNPAAARDFYGNILGLPFVSDDQFALVFNANGITLRVVKLTEFTPVPYTILGWTVSDISRIVAELVHKGVVFQRFEGLEQDPLGIWLSPSGAKIAWFKDLDGNTLSLTQMVMQAT